MAASLLDMEVLSTDATFQNRVQSAIVSTAQNVATEPISAPVSLHLARKVLASQIVNSPNGNPNYKSLFSISIACDPAVSLQASTQAGGPLTTANVAAAAAAVTDTALLNAASAQWNTYIPGI
jgi:hypothetical protein